MDSDLFLRILHVKSDKPIVVDNISFCEWKPPMEKMLLDNLREILPALFSPKE